MSKFVLTAQLQLQAPRNTAQVVNQIQNQLSGVSVPVEVQGAAKAQKQIKGVTAATQQATNAANKMGKSFGVALKRFAAFTIASRAVSLFTNRLANAIDESIQFQRELIKISQVTGKSVTQLKGLSDEISRLSVSLGTSSKELLSVGRVLAQAGVQAGDLRVALAALAKTTLAPTFENISKTAEGAVAILAQFEQGVGALERQLGAINAVAGQFAVESGDLIGAVRRFGGVFKSAGGNLNELLAIFTSVRATTRESSESISTGLRTIFTRIQRPRTIQFLRELGVELTNAEGKFVGPFEAVKRLSKALKDMPAGDLGFIRIAEELGGFRQIGKVIPLLQQFELAEKARQAALKGGDSLTKDAATAQQALAVQIVKVKEEFLALVRGVTESTAFQAMAKTALTLASALIKVADTLKPILPLLGAFAAFKVSQGLGGFAAGIGAAFKGKHAGGKIHAFARGGMVPGSGNRDTVPAMLSPGEFVIRKSSVKKLGAERLHSMNQYASGGKIKDFDSVFATSNMYFGKKQTRKGVSSAFEPGTHQFTTQDEVIASHSKKAHSPTDLIKRIQSSTEQKLRLANQYDSLKSNTTAQGSLYESMLRMAGIMLPKSDEGTKYGGTAPLDGHKGARLYEVKRTPVSETKIHDKRLRHEFNENKLRGHLLTGSGDKITLSGVTQIHPGSEFSIDKAYKASLRKRKKSLGGFAQYADGTGPTGASKKDIAIAALQSEHGLTLNQAQKVHKNPQLLDATLKKRKGPQRQQVTLNPNTVGGLFLDIGTDKTTGINTSFKKGTLQGKGFGNIERLKASVGTHLLDKKASTAFNSALGPAIETAMGTIGSSVASNITGLGLPADGAAISDIALKRMDQRSIAGHFWEGALGGLTGASLTESGATFDFMNVGDEARKRMKALFGSKVSEKFLEAKATLNRGAMNNDNNSIQNKIISGINSGLLQKKDFTVEKFASGGSVSDIVPALLTPGEFVVNKKSAQSIGYANLNRMNKRGVEGFAGGGPVGVQRFASGGEASGGGMMGIMMGVSVLGGALTTMADTSTKAGKALADMSSHIMAAVTQFMVITQVSKFGAETIDNFAKGAKRGEDSAETFARQLSEIRGEGIADVAHVTGVGSPAEKTKAKEVASEARTEEEKATSSLKESIKARGGEIETGEQVKDQIAKQLALQEEQQGLELDQTEQREATAFKDQKVQERSNAEAETEAASAALKQSRIDDTAAQAAKKTTREKANEAAEQEAIDRNNAKLVADKRRVGEALSAKGASEAEEHAQKVGQKRRELEQVQSSVHDKDKEIRDAKSRDLEDEAEQSKVQKQFRTTQKSRAKLFEERAKQEDIVKTGKKGGKQLSGEQIKAAEKALQGLNDQLESNEEVGDRHTKRLQELNDQRKKNKKTIEEAEKALPGLNANLDKTQAEFNTLDQATEDVLKSTGRNSTALRKLREAEEEAAQTAEESARTRVAADQAAANASDEAEQSSKDLAKSQQRLVDSQANETKVQKKLEDATWRVSWAKEALQKQMTKLEVAIARPAQAFRKFGNIWKGVGNTIKRVSQKVASSMSKMNKRMAGVANGVVGAIGLMQQASAFFTKKAEENLQKAIKAGDREGSRSALGQKRRAEDASAVLGGAMTGAMMGAALGPMGMLAGATIGAMMGAALGPSEEEKDKKQRQEMGTISAQIGASNIANFSRKVDKGEMEVTGLDGFAQKASSELSQSMSDVRKMEEGSPERVKAEIQLEKAAIAAGTKLGQSAKSQEEFNKGLEELARNGPPELQKQLINAANAARSLIVAQQALAKANLDTLKIMSTFNAAGNAVNNMLSSFETGSIALDRSIATMEAAQKNLGMGKEGAQALDAAESDVLKAVGGRNSAVGKSVERSFGRAREVNKFMAGVQNSLSNLDVSAMDNDAAREAVRGQLMKGVEPGSDMAKAINAAIDSPDFDPTGDMTDIIKKIQEGVEPLSRAALESAKALANHQKTIVKLTQQRRQAEQQYIQTQKQAIDQQLAAAKLFEEFGGARLTTGQQVSARLAQFNLQSEDAGVGRLEGGSLRDISRMSASIGREFATQQTAKIFGAGTGMQAFGGAAGVDKDRTRELQRANKALITFTKQRISLLKEELAIVKKKNAEEKTSLEKLLSGDIEGFMKGQAAAGAAEALRSGDIGLAQLFDTSALAAGFKSLQGQGLSGAEMQRAASIALSSVGIQDQRSAQLLSENTAEEERLKAEGRGLSKSLGDQAQMMANMESMNVDVAQAKIQIANATFADTMAAKGKQQDRADAFGMSKGGLLYANRGVFVPRGTDTVPAMLTPGEFVVNRAAVHRGNNLQILRAMNGNTTAQGTSSAAMSSGGQVRYYNEGGFVENMGQFFSSVQQLPDVFKGFADAVAKLENMQISVKLDPTDVNVNFNGASFLSTLDDTIRTAVVGEVARQLPKLKQNQTGGTEINEGVLG